MQRNRKTEDIALPPNSFPFNLETLKLVVRSHVGVDADKAVLAISADNRLLTIDSRHPAAPQIRQFVTSGAFAALGAPVGASLPESMLHVAPAVFATTQVNIIWVFLIGTVLVAVLWAMILTAWINADEKKGRRLIELLGGVDLSGDGASGLVKAKGRLRGAGLLGTITILVFTCIVAWLINDQTVRDAPQPAEHTATKSP